ncbi:hypothetical protein JCM11251_005317 [Rhodosporidiobolus azoricus]
MQLSKSVVRASKNAWSYSGVESKVRDATSNDPAGPSVLQMSDIAQWSFNQQDCIEIVTMLDKRLNDKGKNWRHVWKSLALLDYLAHYGSFAVVRYFRNNIHLIKTLKEFQHVDEHGTDVGRNVREQAINLSALLLNDERLRRERGNGGRSSRDSRSLSRHLAEPQALSPSASSSSRPRSVSQPLPTSSDRARSSRQAVREREAKELGMAMQASKEDEAKRLGLLRAQAGETLFGDFSKPQEDTPLVDLAGETEPAPQDPMQQLYEAQLRQNALLQAQQHEQQQAALFAYQVQQQQQVEANYATFQQQQAFNALAQQAAYEQYQAQQQAQYVAEMQAMRYQQDQQASIFFPRFPPPSITPGQNNPFASFASPDSPQPSLSSSFTSSRTASSFSSLSPPPVSSALSPPTPEGRPRAATTSLLHDEKHAQLAALIGAGGGVDTFGNVGDMRMFSGRHY